MSEENMAVLRLDVQNELLLIDETVIPLKPKEYAILHFLVSNPGRLLKKNEILKIVWAKTIVSENAVKEYVRDLRKILADDPKFPKYIKTEHGKGYRFIGKIDLVNRTPVSPASFQPIEVLTKNSNIPIVLVLPYEVIMGGVEWRLFSHGLSVELVTNLARIPDINVVPRTVGEGLESAARADYCGFRSADITVYVLDGSIQANESKINIQSWLVNTNSGFIIWTDRYITESDNLFDIQHIIAERVAMTIGGLEGEILRNEMKAIRRKQPSSLKAYELYLAGRECEKKLDLANTIEGIKLIEKAIEMEPEFSRAWTVLGCLYNNALSLQIIDDEEKNGYIAKGRAAVMKAYELDPHDPIAIIELGAMYARDGDLDFSRVQIERAHGLISNNIDAHVNLAKYTFFVLDQLGDASKLFDRYLRYTPNPTNLYYLQKLRVCYFSFDYQCALKTAKRIPEDIDAMLYTILSKIQIGEKNEVHSLKLAFEKQYPNFDHRIVLKTMPIVMDSHKEHFMDSLFKAELLK